MSKLIDSAIEYKVLNSRAVSLNGSNSANKAFYIDRDGTLWAAFYVNKNINVYSSTDNGFSWEWITTIASTIREGVLQGQPLHFMKSDNLNNIYLCTKNGLVYEIALKDAEASRQPYFVLYLLSVIRARVAGELITGQDGYNDGLSSICGDPDSVFYVFYSNMPGSTLKCSEYSILNSERGFLVADLTEYKTVELLSDSTVGSSITTSEKIDSVSKDRYCHVGYIDMSDLVKYVKYDKQTHSFGSEVTISTPDLTAKDPSIAIDGNDHILYAFGEVTYDNTDITLKIATSSDDGNNWTTATVDKPFNTTVFQDPVTISPELRISVLGDTAGGFLLSAIFTNSDGLSTLYVKQIDTLGVQGDWAQVNSKAADITGNQFFRPLNDRLPYFGNMASIRSAYQVGEGDDKDGNDTTVTSVFQESLINKAFVPDSGTTGLGIDPLISGFLRLDFRVVGSLSDPIDYYNNNIVGDYTDSYIEAMNKIGVSVKVHKYEPVEAATDTGACAYADKVDYTTKIVIDPQTYDFPTIAKETTVFKQFIERDIRKAFFKPDFFMGRTYLLNNGGYIKRTIWTLSYIGNDYEIAQIVPRFVNNEICFYEANLYVIGPSNDPFRKITLPSET